MTRLKARPRQLEVDPECLRWTPVIVTNTVVSDADGDDDDNDEEDEEPEEDNRKEVNYIDFTFALRDKRLIFYAFAINELFYFTSSVNRSNQVTRSHHCLGTCAKGRTGTKRRRKMKKKKRRRKGRASWDFPLAKALQLPLQFAVHPLSQNQHDPLLQQMENADHEDAHPRIGLGAK